MNPWYTDRDESQKFGQNYEIHLNRSKNRYFYIKTKGNRTIHEKAVRPLSYLTKSNQ